MKTPLIKILFIFPLLIALNSANSQSNELNKIQKVINELHYCSVNAWSFHTYLNGKLEDSVTIINAQCNDTIYYEVKGHIKIMIWPGYQLVSYPSAKFVSLSPGAKKIPAGTTINFQDISDSLTNISQADRYNSVNRSSDSSLNVLVLGSDFLYSIKFNKDISELLWIEQLEIVDELALGVDIRTKPKTKRTRMILRSHKIKKKDIAPYLNPNKWVNIKSKRLKSIWKKRGYSTSNLMD